MKSKSGADTAHGTGTASRLRTMRYAPNKCVYHIRTGPATHVKTRTGHATQLAGLCGARHWLQLVLHDAPDEIALRAHPAHASGWR